MNIKFQKMREIDLTKEQKLLCVNDYKVYDVDETGKYIKEKVVFYGGKTYDYNGSYCVVDENSFYRALNGDEIRKFFIPSPEQEETKKNVELVEGSITAVYDAFGYAVAAFRYDDDHIYRVLVKPEPGMKHGDKVELIIMTQSHVSNC